MGCAVSLSCAAQIWSIADSKSKGWLGREEFYTAMQLVDAARKGQMPRSATVKPPFDPNNISPEQMRTYDNWFKQQDTERTGSITAEKTWNFLMKSKLGPEILKPICMLAVCDPDGQSRP